MTAGEQPTPAPAARVLSLVTIAIAVAVVITTIVGLLRMWHPLPYTDVWDGYGNFWYRVHDGNPWVWWEQHNEHRILLARVLFWADMWLLDGSTVLPVIANVLLLAVATSLVVLLAERHVRTVRGTLAPTLGFAAVASCCVITCWSWYEITNLEWAFQVAFFLCVALALGTFAAMAAAATSADRNRRRFTAMAVACAVLSPWTIPVGLMVPFVASALAGIVGLGRRWVAALIAIGVASCLVYAIGFRPMRLGGSGLAVLNDPLGSVVFALTFLGGPALYLTHTAWAAAAAGLALLVFTVVALAHLRRGPARSPFGLALLAYLVLTIGAAGMVTLGRGDRGLEAASADRYQVLILVAWACAIGVLAPAVQGGLARARILPMALLAAFALLMLLPQSGAMADMSAIRDGKDRAALTIALGIRDERTLAPVHPDHAFVLRMGARLAADGKTVLADEPWASLLRSLGGPTPSGTSIACSVDGATTDPWQSAGFARITGRADLAAVPPEPALIAVTDAAGRVVGYVLATDDDSAGRVDLYGYVRAESAGTPLRLAAAGSSCHVTMAGR